MDIVARAKGMLLTPAQEWSAVAAESTDVATLFRSYVMPLAGVSALGAFLAGLFSGMIGFAIASAIITFVMALISVFVIGKIAEILAPNFGAPQDSLAAMKLAAHAPTAAWIAGFFAFVPILGGLIALAGGIYSLYLYYLGGPPVMRVPQDKALMFTIAIVVVAIVVYAVLAIFVGGLIVRAFI
ncbi:MAG TPA: Yip1 family protein [Acetobacteraceae bacterium]|nr:Yip1 family protein [Acetobacteraceae bacterium]